MRDAKRIAWALLMTGLLALAGCNPVKEEVEKSVAQSLPEAIGPAKSYEVRAYGSTFRMMKGKLDGLDIVGTDVRLANGMTVSRLDVVIRDLLFDTGTRQVKRVKTTDFKAALAESELSRYVAKRYPKVPELKVGLMEGFVRVSARPGVSRVRASVVADADLLIRRQRIIALDLRKLKVAGIGAPGFAREYIDSHLDEIFDAKDLGFDARIRSAEVRPRLLTLSGDLDLMKVMAGNGAK